MCRVLRTTILLLLATLPVRSSIFLEASPTDETTQPRPNIVLIMADDLGFSDVGCYGGEIETPHIDRLARGGLRFTQFYNCGLCGTTRAAMLTGLYPHTVGIRNWTGTINARGILFTELLQAAGYHTMMVGKWDGSVPPGRRGIDRFFGFNTLGPISYFNEVVSSPFYLNEARWPVPPEGFYITDALTDYAVKFIEEAATFEKPFFLYSANIAPHWPLQAPEQEIARYRERYRQAGWDTLRRERYRRQVEMGLIDARHQLAPRDARVPAWERVEQKAWQAERMAVYAAQVDRLDRNIGRIVAALKEAGAWENTLILFLSDNGPADQPGYDRPEMLNNYRGRGPWRSDGTPMIAGNDPSVRPGVEGHFAAYGPEWAQVSNVPFRLYKVRAHEGGISTPLVAHWPAKIVRPGITSEVGHVIDVAATCLDLAGADYPAQWEERELWPLEGKSLLPVFEAGARTGHESLCWEFAGHRAVRMGPWKLVALARGPWELYDLQHDRTELRNLADRQPDRVATMAAAWEAWAKRVGVYDRPATIGGELAASRIGYWPGEGNATDLAGDNDGKRTPGAPYVEGRVGRAFALRRPGQHVTLAGKLTNTAQGTLTAWVNPATAGDGDCFGLFGSGGGDARSGRLWIARLQGEGEWLRLELLQRSTGQATNQVATAAVIAPDKWTHVAIAANGKAWSVYLNGNPEPLRIAAGANLGTWLGEGATVATDVTAIGAQPEKGGFRDPFVGRIDEVMLFDRPLDPAEIKDVHSHRAVAIASAGAGQ